MTDTLLSEDQVSAVAREVTARVDRDAVVASMIALYIAEHPPYAGLPEEVRDGALRDVVRSGVDEAIAIFTGDPPPAVDPDDPATSAIERHAALGIPEGEVVAAISKGGPLVWAAILAAGETGELPALTQAATRWQRYLAAGKHKDGVVPADRAADSRVLFDLLTGERAPGAVLEQAGARLGLDMRHALWRPVVIRVHTDGNDDALVRCADELLASGHPATVRADATLALVPPDDPAAVPGHRGLTTAVGQPCDASQLRDGLRDADHLARMGVAAGRSGVVTAGALADELLAPSELLADNPRLVDDLNARVLAPLRRHDERRHQDLVGTLRAYVEKDFHLGRAADALHLHPNSLIARLARIAELTQLDVARTEDRLTMTLAAWVSQTS